MQEDFRKTSTAVTNVLGFMGLGGKKGTTEQQQEQQEEEEQPQQQQARSKQGFNVESGVWGREGVHKCMHYVCVQ